MVRIPLLVILLVPSALLAQTADEKQATLKFLYALQQPDGGFIPAPMDPRLDAAPRSSLRATTAAVRAIKYFGGELPNKEKTMDFVASCCAQPSGGFSDRPKGTPDVTSTAVGMMAAKELFPDKFHAGPSTRYLAKNAKSFEERRLAVAGMEAFGTFAPEIKDWFAEIEKTRHPDGTYGSGDGQARETGGIVAMFLRAGQRLPREQRKAVLAALQKGQRPDGGFGKAGAKGSDGETTYRVMRAFHLLREQPKDVAKVREFLHKCRNADGGYGVAPGQPSTAGGTYFAASVGHWLGN